MSNYFGETCEDVVYSALALGFRKEEGGKGVFRKVCNCSSRYFDRFKRRQHSIVNYQDGVNYQKLRACGLRIYRLSRAILTPLAQWLSHRTVNCWHLAQMTRPSSSGILVHTGDLHQTPKGHSHWIWTGTDTDGLSLLEEQWIVYRGKSRLWLPPNYRPICLAFKAVVVALAHPSGRVSFISELN